MIMNDDSDHELSELDIESKTWKKVKDNMKTIGFREGAAKGRGTTLQEGFNEGYSDGFYLGERLGLMKGIISFKKDLGIPVTEKYNFSETDLENFSSEACIICPKDNKYKAAISEEIYSEKFENINVRQKEKNQEIISSIENSNNQGSSEKS